MQVDRVAGTVKKTVPPSSDKKVRATKGVGGKLKKRRNDALFPAGDMNYGRILPASLDKGQKSGGGRAWTRTD